MPQDFIKVISPVCACSYLILTFSYIEQEFGQRRKYAAHKIHKKNEVILNIHFLWQNINVHRPTNVSKHSVYEGIRIRPSVPLKKLVFTEREPFA